jgi:hypothetical protein
MKIELHVEHLSELSTLIATVDKHRVGACIVLLALIGIPALVFCGYLLLR